jgi:hypothetical protein
MLESNATDGATLGRNMFMPDGTLTNPVKLREYMGLPSANPTAVNHRLLAGLTVGNDHPQYTRKDTLTTPGDIYVRGASTVERLGIGTDRFFPRSNGTTVAWEELLGFGSGWDWTHTGTNLNFSLPTLAGNWLELIDNGVTAELSIGAVDLLSVSSNDILELAAANGMEVFLGSHLEINGDSGTPDQVLTSHGPGTPPTWEDASGGYPAQLGYAGI